MIERLKNMTVISWGGYQYFSENISKLVDLVEIQYVFANKKYVANAEKYHIIEEKEKILEMDNPFVIISQARISDVETAVQWCRENNIPYSHLDLIVNNGKYNIKYIKAIGGIYRDFNDNVIEVSDGAKGNIIIETQESKKAHVSIGKISVRERLYIKMFGINAKFIIGNNTSIVSLNAIVNTNGKVQIGNDCMFSHTISLMQSDQHQIFDMYSRKRINHKKDIYIGNHVWVGRECELLPGASIGDNCVCGARTTTSAEFPPNVILAGCPAKIIRENIIWARDNIKDRECNTFDECKDQKALRYINDVRKKELKLYNNKKTFEETVIELYKRGITTQEIADYIEKNYGHYYKPRKK